MITVAACAMRLLSFFGGENMKTDFRFQTLRYEILNRLKNKGGSNIYHDILDPINSLHFQLYYHP
jgi:hypothetical protein